MLEELSVRNYALIDNLTLSFENGLNIITGETGAGKSIIVGALSFLLGAKTAADCIRTGAEEMGVSAVILVAGKSLEALSWLEARDIKLEDERLIVRRSLKTNGRGSVFMQNIPVSRADLAEFMALIFDIHGQHEHESLMRRETHRKYLDRFAGIETDVAEFNRIFLLLAEKRKIIETAQASKRERDAKIELLSFAVDEIEKAQLKTGESRELEAEASCLASFEKLAAFIETASLACFEDGASVLSLSRKTRTALENAANIDSGLAALEQRLAALYFEADDIAAELRSYRDKLSFDPARLEFVEERLAFIYKLKKKYAKNELAAPHNELFGETKPAFTVEDVILAYKTEAEAEIEALSASEENREKLKTEIAALEKEIMLQAKALTARRTAASAALGEKITAILRRLGMPNARFAVRLDAKERQNTAAPSIVLGPYGADDIEFLFSANAGEPLKELARIASGGELSRVMLAVKTTLSGGVAEQTGAGAKNGSATGTSPAPRLVNVSASTPSPVQALQQGGEVLPPHDASPDTLIFDEIDTGIGGEVAIAVGEELAKIAADKQVLCVTHLASIACRADNHLFVEKMSDGERTVTLVRNLSAPERRQEIARLLSGDTGSVALAHADELLARYSKKGR